jgi:hypothetical protein
LTRCHPGLPAVPGYEQWVERDVIPGAVDIDLSRSVGRLATKRYLVLEQVEVGTPEDALESICEQLRIPNSGRGRILLLHYAGFEDERLKPQEGHLEFFNYLGRQEGLPNEVSLLQPARESVGITHDPRNHSLRLL